MPEANVTSSETSTEPTQEPQTSPTSSPTQETTETAPTQETSSTETPESTTTETTEDSAQPPADAVSLESLELPEGLEFEPEKANEFLAVMNDESLSRQELTQKLTTMYAGLYQEISQANQKEFLEMNKQWIDESKKLFGGEQQLGDKIDRIDQTIVAYDDAIKASTTVNGQPPEAGQEFRDVLTLTGAGNHPAVIRYLAWVSEQLTEGSPLSGSPPTGQRSREDRMFGSSG